MVTHANPRSREIGRYVNDYDTATRFLGKYTHRKLTNNTYVNRAPDFLSVKLHSTSIVKFYPDGRVELNSGGYRTKTTKQRMNEMLPPGFSVEQKDYSWRVRAPDGSKQDFFDGIILQGPLPEATRERLMNLSRQMSTPDYPGHQPNPDAKEVSRRVGDTMYRIESAGIHGWMLKANGTVIYGPTGDYNAALGAFRERTGHQPNPKGELWVDVWEERDRLSIILYRGTPGDPNESVTVAEWWDDDARAMIEDGFFNSRDLKDSVLNYARDVGLK